MISMITHSCLKLLNITTKLLLLQLLVVYDFYYRLWYFYYFYLFTLGSKIDIEIFIFAHIDN